MPLGNVLKHLIFSEWFISPHPIPRPSGKRGTAILSSCQSKEEIVNSLYPPGRGLPASGGAEGDQGLG
jgi:hypothetical protein